MEGRCRSAGGGRACCDPESELRLQSRKRGKGEDNKWDGKKKRKEKCRRPSGSPSYGYGILITPGVAVLSGDAVRACANYAGPGRQAFG